jgi:hypothetical protein
MSIMSYGQSLPEQLHSQQHASRQCTAEWFLDTVYLYVYESASGHPGHRDRALRTCGCIDKQKVVVLGAREVFPPLFEGLAQPFGHYSPPKPSAVVLQTSILCAQYFNSVHVDLYVIYNNI